MQISSKAPPLSACHRCSSGWAKGSSAVSHPMPPSYQARSYDASGPALLQACRRPHSTETAVQGQAEASRTQPQGQANMQPAEQASQQPGQGSAQSLQEDEDDEDRDFHRCNLATAQDLCVYV